MSTLERQYRLSGDYPHVYEFVFLRQQQIRSAPDHYGETECIGWETVEDVEHIVAVSQRLAEAAFWLHKDYPNSGFKLISCTPICVIDQTVSRR